MIKGIQNSARRLLFLTLVVSIASSAQLFPLQNSFGHPVTVGGVSRFFRIDNEQFSANNVATGESIEVKLELASLVNTDITISEARIAVSEISAVNPSEFSRNYTAVSSEQWRIINATHPDDFVLRAGETIPFTMNIMALEPGQYNLHSAFVWSYVTPNGTQINTTYYGRGWKIEVTPNDNQVLLDQFLEVMVKTNDDRTIHGYGEIIPFNVTIFNAGSKIINLSSSDLKVYAGLGYSCASLMYFDFIVLDGDYSKEITSYEDLLRLKDKAIYVVDPPFRPHSCFWPYLQTINSVAIHPGVVEILIILYSVMVTANLPLIM